MHILVSGAGMAGLSAGINLAAGGHRVTIVERSDHLRVNGSPIDVRGEAIDVAARMGLLDAIRARRIEMTDLVQFVDSEGVVQAELPGGEVSDSADDIEIPREDLSAVLLDALPAAATLVFDESIATLHDDGDGVDVAFVSGRRGRYDLVVGADGMHSLTRRLSFGPERDYLRHLGFYVALTDLPDEGAADRSSTFLNLPGLLVGIARYNDKALGVFNFRSEPIDYDYHDLDAQKQLLIDAFAGHDVWKVPELLDAVRKDPEFYFGAVGQIHLPSWHRGRVVLVGDAAHCASGLSGRGTSLAITGAYYLAEELARHPEDLERAFGEYERRQRPHVVHAQASAGPGGDLVVPATEEAIAARNERLRIR